MQQKLKKIAIPTIYVLSVVAFGLSIYFIQLIVSNVVFQDPEPNLKFALTLSDFPFVARA